MRPTMDFLSRMTISREVGARRCTGRPAGPPPPTMATSVSMIFCMWSEEGAWCSLGNVWNVGVNAEVFGGGGEAMTVAMPSMSLMLL